MTALYAAYADASSSRSLTNDHESGVARPHSPADEADEEPLTARPTRHSREAESVVSDQSHASIDLLDEIDRAIGEAIDDVRQLPDGDRFQRRRHYDARQSRDVPVDVAGEEDDVLAGLAQTTDDRSSPPSLRFSSPPTLELSLPAGIPVPSSRLAIPTVDADGSSLGSSLPSISAGAASSSASGDFVEVMQDGSTAEDIESAPFPRSDSPTPMSTVTPLAAVVTPPGPSSPLKAVNGADPYSSPTPSPSRPSGAERRSSLVPRAASLREERSPRLNGVNGIHSAVDLSTLVRNRPLPHACYFGDVVGLRGPGDRAKAYATKINELGKEDSGLDTWVAHVRARGRQRSVPQPRRASAPPSLPPSCRAESASAERLPSSASSHFGHNARTVSLSHARYEPSIMSEAEFPLRATPGASGRAHDLTSLAPISPPSTLSAAVPYPQLVSAGGGPSSMPSAPSTRPGFFGLGRKSSKRSVSRGAISGPTLLRTASGSSGISGPRPLEGIHDVDEPQPPPAHARSGPGHRASISSPLAVVPSAMEQVEVDTEKLDQLCDVLPHAEREVLRRYLVRSGGSELDAVDAFLADERRNQLL
jgi:hypothetical protein